MGNPRGAASSAKTPASSSRGNKILSGSSLALHRIGRHASGAPDYCPDFLIRFAPNCEIYRALWPIFQRFRSARRDMKNLLIIFIASLCFICVTGDSSFHPTYGAFHHNVVVGLRAGDPSLNCAQALPCLDACFRRSRGRVEARHEFLSRSFPSCTNLFLEVSCRCNRTELQSFDQLD